MLTILILVPLVGALADRVRCPPTSSRSVALGVSAGTLGLGVAVAIMYDVDGGMQMTEQVSWIKAFGVHYALGVDGLGLLLVLLTVVLVPIVLVADWDAGDRDPKSFYGWVLALEALSLAVFLRHRRVPLLRRLRGHADPGLLPGRRASARPRPAAAPRRRSS